MAFMIQNECGCILTAQERIQHKGREMTYQGKQMTDGSGLVKTMAQLYALAMNHGAMEVRENDNEQGKMVSVVMVNLRTNGQHMWYPLPAALQG